MSDDALLAGRAALARYAWAQGFELLSGLDDPAQLTARDLEQLGEAAFWTGRPQASIRYREQSFAAYNKTHSIRDAARVALYLVWDHFGAKRAAVARGWLAKAQRLLADQPECHEHGLLSAWQAELLIFEGKLEAALALARETFAIGERLDDSNLQAISLTSQGSILLRMGETAEGLACIDEGMASAVGGALLPWITGAIYCTTISACQRIGDVRRANEWTEVIEHSAQTPGRQDFPGDCRAHKVSLLRVTGQWDEAEAAAAFVIGLTGFESSHLATVYCEIGEMRVYRGQYTAAGEAFDRAEDLGRSPQPGRALLCLAEGNTEAAMSFIDGALIGLTWDRLARARLLPACVRIALAAGRLDTAREAAEELETVARTYDTIALNAAAATAMGRVLAAEGDTPAAARRLHEAVERWMDLPAPFEAASVRLSLAEMLHAKGRLDEAKAEARSARASLAKLGAAPDAARAGRLLEAIERERMTRRGASARVTRTFMFTDIVGSTRLIEALGDDAWRNMLRWHDRLLRAQFAAHGGEEIDHAGDGFFVAFENADAALDCAVAIQRGLVASRTEHGFSPAVRIGVHQADASQDNEGLSGKGVHHAARIAALAEADQILVSEETLAAAGRARAAGPAREVVLKGISAPCRVTTLTWSADRA